jgi:uncharacterized protein (UPF0262 family)
VVQDSQQPHRLQSVELDEESLAAASRDQEQERQIAIFDLLEQNYFFPEGAEGGPYDLRMGLLENRLLLDIRGPNYERRHILSLSPFRTLIKDYFMICDSYYQAIRNSTPQQIEALDMGRRGLHNEASELLRRGWTARSRPTWTRRAACSPSSAPCTGGVTAHEHAPDACPTRSSSAATTTRCARRWPKPLQALHRHRIFVDSAACGARSSIPTSTTWRSIRWPRGDEGTRRRSHQHRCKTFDDLTDDSFDLVISLTPRRSTAPSSSPAAATPTSSTGPPTIPP